MWPLGWLFDGRQGPPDRLIPRWLFLRALGAIYFSAFFSLVFQIRGLISPTGILPAGAYLHAVAQSEMEKPVNRRDVSRGRRVNTKTECLA